MPDRDVITLVPAPSELDVERVLAEPHRLVVIVRARRAAAHCPICGCRSRRVHSHYERHLADLPWHGLAIALTLRVRRFRCELPLCPRRIFCERLPGTAIAYARRTTRLARALELVGLALGGEAGGRLARALGMGTGASADTLLRLLKAPPASSTPAPPVRVLGVDDWAWRKGQRYGTILLDLERHAVIDLLPDREAETLATWLAAHPGIEFISRDRVERMPKARATGRPTRFRSPIDSISSRT